jgi:EEF1A lysine methyltransferase 4
MLGCGNSRNYDRVLFLIFISLGFSEEMCYDGFKDIFNVDYFEKVIEMMKERTKDIFSSLKWATMDFRNMSELEGSTFDVVLDKGSLDALWSDGGSQWDPSDSVLNDINCSLNEVMRLLKPGGKFISITFGQPHFRLPHMNRPGYWDLVSNEKLGLYFIYTFQKHLK